MDSPSFGTMIRAARLGWGFSRKHGAFIRITDITDEKNLIELSPGDQTVPVTKTPNRYHRVWWDDPVILDMIPWLKGITRIKKLIRVFIDNEGTILKEKP